MKCDFARSSTMAAHSRSRVTRRDASRLIGSANERDSITFTPEQSLDGSTLPHWSWLLLAMVSAMRSEASGVVHDVPACPARPPHHSRTSLLRHVLRRWAQELHQIIQSSVQGLQLFPSDALLKGCISGLDLGRHASD